MTVIDLSTLSDPSLEMTGVELQLDRGKKVRIINIYVKHQHPINTDKLRTILYNQVPTVIIGDYNAKLDIPLNSNTNRNGDLVADLIANYDIVPILPDSHARYQTPDLDSLS